MADCDGSLCQEFNHKKNILMLNNDCLIKIMSSIDDYPTFYNFSLTCKRFFAVVSKVSQDWNETIKSRKIMFYAMQFMSKEYLKLYCDEHYIKAKDENWPGLGELTKSLYLYDITIPTLENVNRVWRAKGSVTAFLLTFIKNIRIIDGPDLRYADDNNTTVDRYKEITLYVDGEDAKFTLQCYPKERLTITARFDGAEAMVEIKGPHCQRISDYYYLVSKDDLSTIFGIVGNAGRLIDLIAGDLGELNRPITGQDLAWILFYPESIELESYPGSNSKLEFTGPVRDNDEPSLRWVMIDLNRWCNVGSLLNIMGKSKNIKRMVEVVRYCDISQKSFLAGLSRHLFNLILYFDFIPNELLSWLVLVTTLLPCTYDKNRAPFNAVELRCLKLQIKKGQVLLVKLGCRSFYPYTGGDSLACFYFELPDGSIINFPKNETIAIDDFFHGYNSEFEYRVLSKLTPVIELITDNVHEEFISDLDEDMLLTYAMKYLTIMEV